MCINVVASALETVFFFVNSKDFTRIGDQFGNKTQIQELIEKTKELNIKSLKHIDNVLETEIFGKPSTSQLEKESCIFGWDCTNAIPMKILERKSSRIIDSKLLELCITKQNSLSMALEDASTIIRIDGVIFDSK